MRDSRPSRKLVPPDDTPPHSGSNERPYDGYGATLAPSHAL